ncbi:MAG: hypothetical protein ACI9RU_000744 [Litorivivens sp.]|jgi:hypothetical protein
MQRILLLIAAVIFAVPPLMAQCEDGLIYYEVVYVADNYPQESTWELVGSGGQIYAQANAESGNACIPEGECVIFNIYDTASDGICCGFGEGSYAIYEGGVLITSGGEFGSSETVLVSCPQGASCDTALPSEIGSYIGDFDDNWYTFIPDETGIYVVTTCNNSNSCDTRLWVYDYCNMGDFDDTNEASIYYDDNEGGCDELAQINALLEEGVEYLIRIGDSFNDCAGSIGWSLSFTGPPGGCTDSEMCNYSPLAIEDDGSCVPFGDPSCTGPDLLVVQEAIVNSLYVDYLDVNENDCYIEEGCLNGFGTRELIRFTTHIKNIGDVDYYIGQAGNDVPGQFDYADCHNHWHYAGYAEYALLDSENNWLPIGFKNGFCVIDLECSGGGTAQYGCSNMGISAGCGDYYGSGLSCQWIDVTDVADGQYTLIVRVNWDESPDAQGHYELTYDNNWAQVCLDIDRTSGTLEYTVLEDCAVYVDCMGVELGLATIDCNGDCGGFALAGDLDNNGAQEFSDATSYVDQILSDDIDPTLCNDLDTDGNLTVTDASLIALCQYYNVAHEHPDSSGVHQKCNLPTFEVVNINDSVWFRIADFNLDQNYIDIEVKNPYNRIVGYQLVMSGIEITQVTSIADPITYPISPEFSLGGQELIGLSYEDSSLVKNNDFQPLARLYFINPDELICIESIVDVVNEAYHNTLNYIADECISTVGVNQMALSKDIQVFPNPFVEQTEIQFSNLARIPFTLELTDLSGRVVRKESGIVGSTVMIDRQDLEAGTYYFVLTGDYSYTGKLTVQ